jgi:hypothetical protein
MNIRSIIVFPEQLEAAKVINSVQFECRTGFPLWSSDGLDFNEGVLLHVGRTIDTICDPENGYEEDILGTLKRAQQEGYTHILVFSPAEYEEHHAFPDEPDDGRDFDEPYGSDHDYLISPDDPEFDGYPGHRY